MPRACDAVLVPHLEVWELGDVSHSDEQNPQAEKVGVGTSRGARDSGIFLVLGVRRKAVLEMYSRPEKKRKLSTGLSGLDAVMIQMF